MFSQIGVRSVDQLMALMQEFRADPRDQKVDLVVGVYMDDSGVVPIMKAVKESEQHIHRDESTKNYVGIAGDAEFRDLVPGLLLGELTEELAGRFASLQTPGGTGALKVGMDLLNSINPGMTIWVSTPTWANHVPIAKQAGLKVKEHPYFRPSDRGLDFDAMMEHLREHAQSGDAILLHACCHNPTGVDLGPADWPVLTDFVAERGLLPFVDCAYQGLGMGLEEDVAGLRVMAARVPEMLIANSFSKSFGIYCERCGALTIVAEDPELLARTVSAAQSVIRSNYSMPPSHGARIVSTVLNDDSLKAAWSLELTEMRERIAAMRTALRKKLEERQVTQDLSFLTDQRGMFSYTGFTPDMVKTLRETFGIYIAGDGRINVAAICSGNIDTVADGFASVLRDA